MTDDNFTQKREHVRVDYVVNVTMESEDNFFTGFVKNISAGGLFIATHEPRELGEKFFVSFTIPNIQSPLRYEVIVRWVRPYNPATPEIIPGIGVQFINLPKHVQDAINSFIKTRETIFYDE